MVCDFTEYINEIYLDSGIAPLYHSTNTYYLNDILDENILKVGWFENPYLGKSIQMISLSRNKNYKSDNNVILELDKNKMLIDGYKIIPYDYFIHSMVEYYPKSSLKRKSKFEFEEIVLTDITEIDRYILSINFMGDSMFTNPQLINKIIDKNIKILDNGRLL